MKFKHTQPCTRSNKSERTIRPRRYIGQLARTVAGDAIAALDMADEIHFLGHNRQSRREAPATADSGIVERASHGSRASASGGLEGGERANYTTTDTNDGDGVASAPLLR